MVGRTTCFREQLPRCVWEAEGGADARAGGRATPTMPPSSPRCLSATMPPHPPRGGDSRGPVRSRITDGRAALADRWGGALDCTRRRRCCAVICNKYIAVTYVKSREISQYCRENKSENQSPENATIDALVAAQPLSRGGGRRQLVRHGG